MSPSTRKQPTPWKSATFDGDGAETRTRLAERSGHVFHGILPGVQAGSRYGVRVDGAWNPGEGLRHNVNKLLLDPHATAIEGGYDWGQAVFAHDLNSPDEFDATDSAASVPRCVVTDSSFDWDEGTPDVSPRIPLAETVVYEVHVKGFTRQHPEVPEDIRGTYAGLAHPAAIKHLTDLGVTAVELLPVHQFVQDSHLGEKGLRNYWGYNSIGFFAPHGEYSSAGDGGGQVAEFKAMVKALAHSKGGLIGKYMMMALDPDVRIKRMVAVCSPFSGSRYAGFMWLPSLRAFSPRNAVTLQLTREERINARSTSVYGLFDPHIPEGSVLPGARNIRLVTGGHFRILGDDATVRTIVEETGAA